MNISGPTVRLMQSSAARSVCIQICSYASTARGQATGRMNFL